MGEKPNTPDSLFTLPLVLGVIVVVGGVAALTVSGLFVYRAHLVSLETQRIQAALQLEREKAEQAVAEAERKFLEEAEALRQEQRGIDSMLALDQMRTTSLDIEPFSIKSGSFKPGQRLQAQRPIHWDQAEIVDILEDQKIKVRWLSGEPGEEIIEAELVRGEDAPTEQ